MIYDRRVYWNDKIMQIIQFDSFDTCGTGDQLQMVVWMKMGSFYVLLTEFNGKLQEMRKLAFSFLLFL